MKIPATSPASSSPASATPATWLWNHALVVVAILTLVAFSLRLYHLDARTLFGDEYNSIQEALAVGRNPQSLLYFGVLHLWISLGSSDFWLRFPSVFFGVLAIPASYQLGRRALSHRTGLMLAALLAVSSLAIQYSQQVRFYSLFLLTASLSMVAFEGLCRDRRRRFARALWCVSSVLVILSHLFGVLVPVSEIAIGWASSAQGSRRLVRFGVVGLFMLALLAIIPVLVNSATFSGLERLIGGSSPGVETHSRGLGLANLAKIPLAYYFFSLGEAVYPLALPVSALGALLFAAVAVLGVFAFQRSTRAWFWLPMATVPVLFVYLVLDPSAPSFTETASVRHVTMVLPTYLLLVAAFVEVGSWKKPALVALGVTTACSIWLYFYGPWSYTIPVQQNWREIAGFIEHYGDEQTVVLYDGRSGDALARYLDPHLVRLSYWPYLESDDVGELMNWERVIFIANDFQEDRRRGFNRILELLEQGRVNNAAQIRYPVFVYTFDDGPPEQGAGYPVDAATGEITVPKEIYGLEFQDLLLPAQASFGGNSYVVSGGFMLPGLQGNHQRNIPLAGLVNARRVLLFSNVTGSGSLHEGDVLGEMVVAFAEREPQHFPLRLGNETQDWSKECPMTGACQTALTWHKYLALVGQRAYEGTWWDFRARIVGIQLDFDAPGAVQSVTIRYTAGSGQLHIWGMALK